MNLATYHASEPERARTADLERIMPRGHRSALEIGSRDGFFTRILARYFDEVTALDLVRPDFDLPGVTTAQGDVTNLAYPADHFDCVVCTEVLEHVPDYRRAAAEIGRVARATVVIGVPYRQDTRVGRTTCAACGRVNPPWGHVNEFDEAKLLRAFPTLTLAGFSYVWRRSEVTNPLSTWLMDLGGNPWGTYDQEEPCIHCGAELAEPGRGSLPRRALAAVAHRLNGLQSRLAGPRANWIHAVFKKG